MSEPPTKKRKIGGKGKSKKRKKFLCKVCGNDISTKIRIKCQECKNFDLCVGCFYEGATAKTHLPYHKYSVINDVNTPLFVKGWTGEDELHLLEGIEKFGLGNWPAIADHIGTKTKEECEYHYINTYIDNPFPPYQGEERGTGRGKGKSKPKVVKLRKEPKITVDTIKKDDNGMIIKILEAHNKKPFLISQSGKFKLQKKNKEGDIIGTEVGYLPLRGDFITEHCEGAEKGIEEMEFYAGEPEEQREMKKRMLVLYNYRISEREKRKNFVISRGLFDFKKYRSDHKRRTREEKEAFNTYKKYRRFVNEKEWDGFMESVYKSIKLKKDIKKLQNYRRNGICTMSQATLYDNERSRKLHGKKRNPPRVQPENPNQNDDLLSAVEKNFIDQNHIHLREYIVLKDLMIKENFRLGYLTKNSVKKYFVFHPPLLTKVYDFLAYCGWIKAYK